MMKLVLVEARKLRRTYIYPVCIAAMLLPLIFTFFVYYSGNVFSAHNWEAYTNSLHLFYGIFLSALIPSFAAIFSVYSEFKSGAIKTVLLSGNGRVKLIAAKIVCLSLFVIVLYAGAALLAVTSGVMLGFDASLGALLSNFLQMFLPGLMSLIFVPAMIYLTLLFKSFVPPLIIAFLGTIGSVVLINIGNAFYYPWLVPSQLFFRLRESAGMSVWPPVFVFLGYFAVFGVLAVALFVRMDIDNRVG